MIKYVVVAVLFIVLLTGMGYKLVEKDVHQFGKTVDIYEAEILGQYGLWMRSTTKPYPIIYLKVITSDGQIHRLKNVEY